MATPPQTFQLDRTIFNQDLYSKIRDFWYNGSPVDSTTPNVSLSKRWWGLGATEEEKTTFDGECKKRFGQALESIGPSNLSLPPFKDHEGDLANAETLAAPFLTEVTDAQREDAKLGAETLLSLILLLDQVTRNTHRSQKGLRLVYCHYDRLSLALLRSSMMLQPNPVQHPSWRGKSAAQTWLLMPFIHTEYAPALVVQAQWLKALRDECEELDNRADIAYVGKLEEAHAAHLRPMERFGRYPHRNEALGRASTPDEEEYLKTANTFGVKQTRSKDKL
ncbi:hypothetical protein LTR08_002649 [Meristemomyces frigidus]|nr:hypothetical protein LTR08_002649 [Meristemomyces frigidus]